MDAEFQELFVIDGSEVKALLERYTTKITYPRIESEFSRLFIIIGSKCCTRYKIEIPTLKVYSFASFIIFFADFYKIIQPNAIITVYGKSTNEKLQFKLAFKVEKIKE